MAVYPPSQKIIISYYICAFCEEIRNMLKLFTVTNSILYHNKIDLLKERIVFFDEFLVSSGMSNHH